MQRQPGVTPFVATAYLLTWMCWLAIGAARKGWISLPVPEETVATWGQFGPFVSAVLFIGWESGSPGLRRLFSRLVQWRVSAGWLLAAVMFPPIAYSLAIAAHAWWTGRAPQLPAPIGWGGLLLTFGYVLVTGGPLGEELGWRGFALPRLQAQWGSTTASVVLGLIWAGWHLPLWWIAEVPSYAWYLLAIIPLSFLFTTLSNHTQGSVLAAMLFHASLNTALLRLPLFPAYREWTFLVWAVALGLFLLERRRSSCASADMTQ